MEEIDLFSFGQKFSKEEDCLRYLAGLRWPDGVICPQCGSIKVYEYKDGRLYKCANKGCAMQFTAKVHTIFADSHIPLAKWFFAAYLLASVGPSLTSVELAKRLRITQKTAWKMMQRFKQAAATNIDFEGSMKQIISAATAQSTKP